MNEQRLLLYSSKWQALRIGWLADNSTDGGWTTTRGARRAITEMREYLDDAEAGSPEKYARCWRVLNCLNAVRMGYSGQKVAGSERDELVREFRDEVQHIYRVQQKAYGKLSLNVLGIETLDEWGATILAEFDELTPDVQDRILVNLSQRSALHEAREELEWFLELVL